MALSKSLLPRSYMLDDAHDKLTNIQGDIQQEFSGMNQIVSGAYEVSGLDEAGLIALIKSFSLYDLYLSLPSFYHGGVLDSAGIPYTQTLPGGRLGCLRRCFGRRW